MEREDYRDYIIKFLDGEISNEELIDLQHLVKSDSDKLSAFDDFKDIWDASELMFADAQPKGEALKRFRQNIHSNGSSRNKIQRKLVRTVLQTAAIFILAISFSVSYHFIDQAKSLNGSSEIKYTSTHMPLGQKGLVTLSDGSQVWLNSNSTLTYSSDFGSKNREILINGEAYLDVAKNAEIPFIVKTSSISIKVLGTRFNIKTYNNENIVETTLEEGSLQILSGSEEKNEKPLVTLRPNEKATYDKNNRKLHISTLENSTIEVEQSYTASSSTGKNITEVESIVAWKDNNLIIKNESLNEIALKLERWYGLDIEILDESLKNYHYSGKFIHNESIEQVMEVISKTTPINYHIKTNKLTISVK